MVLGKHKRIYQDFKLSADMLNNNEIDLKSLKEIYYKYKDNLWFKSPFYPNNLKSFEIWYNRYLKILEKL